MYRELGSLLRREFLRYIRTPIWIGTSLVLPILYLILFGQGFSIPGGPSYYLGAPNFFSFFSVGMVGFVSLTMSLFSGANIIFDKGLGILKRQVATPAPRSAIFLAPLIFRSLMALIPAFLVLGLALVLAHVPGFVGLTVTGSASVMAGVEVVLAVLVLSLTFNALFLACGFALENPQSYFGLVNLVNLPILFTSNALYPPGDIPSWLATITAYNPVSLSINVMRENLFNSQNYYPYPPEAYLLGLLGWAVAIVAIALVIAARALRTP